MKNGEREESDVDLLIQTIIVEKIKIEKEYIQDLYCVSHSLPRDQI